MIKCLVIDKSLGYLIELKLTSTVLVFALKEENLRTRSKTLGASLKDENQQQTQFTFMMLGPGFEPGQHWWEESALTTTPSLLT